MALSRTSMVPWHATALVFAVAAAVASAPAVAAAQQVDEEAPTPPDARPWFAPVAKWGRWPTLAAAIGLTAAAITKKADADDVYEGLQARCVDVAGTCVLRPDGTYVDAESERLYQETLRLDGQARRWMIGGQAFLFVSGGMFLIDLVVGSSKPENIPFSPLEAYAVPGAVGLRWRY